VRILDGKQIYDLIFKSSHNWNSWSVLILLEYIILSILRGSHSKSRYRGCGEVRRFSFVVLFNSHVDFGDVILDWERDI
jgi:hypothetical protein